MLGQLWPNNQLQGHRHVLSADKLSKDQKAHSCFRTWPCPAKGRDPRVGRCWSPSSMEPTHGLLTSGLDIRSMKTTTCSASQTLPRTSRPHALPTSR